MRVRQQARRVDLSTPSITHRCGVSTVVVDPATSWDEPSYPPLAPGSCEPPGDRCALPLALGGYEALGCGPPLTPGNWEPPGYVPAPS
jgi:hypothetical protein